MELTLQRYSRVVTSLATAFCALLAARAVSIFAHGYLAPRPGIYRAPIELPAVTHFTLEQDRVARLFNLPRPEPTDAGWTPEPTRSPLRAVLVATALAEPSRLSLCLLADGDRGATAVLAAGDEFMGARIYQVLRDKVLIVNQGRNEFIDGGKASSSDRYVVTKKEIHQSDVMTHARVMPAPNGFKIFSIVPGSIYEKLGLQNGDLIRKIGGFELTSPERGLEIYQRLRDARRIDVEIERRGEIIRHDYQIE